jgi:curved DNA-binding protein CbpA
VRPGADLAAVRAAWIRQVREHHPDRHGGDPERQRRGSDRVKDLNRAYREIRRRISRGGS